MMKRRLIAILIATAVLAMVLAIVAVPLLISSYATHASSVQQNQSINTKAADIGMQTNTVTTINNLVRISVVGSTQLIVDKKGRTTQVDANPSDVQIVPSTPATLANGSARTGDLIATNFGYQGKGNTLVAFPAHVGPGHQFNGTTAGYSGLAKEAFNTQTGTNWVTNFRKNSVEIFNPNGTLRTTVTSPYFQKPWGIAFNGGQAKPQEGSLSSFFVANAYDATIDRIDVVTVNGAATFKISHIAKLSTNGYDTPIALTWAATFMINKKHYTDVLLALDPAKNRIAAFPNSTTTSMYPDQGITAFQGKPLNNPGGIALNPLNNDLFVVNLNDNTLLELNADTETVVGTRLVDNVPVDLQTGYGSALSGVTAGQDAGGNLVIYFTDDNTNTVDMLSV